MRIWMWLMILLLPSLGACSCDLRVGGKCRDTQRASDPPLTAKWQLFDADTEKPIEGAWVNFLWYGKADSRGNMPCVRGVLGRTNADGIFEDTARDGSWRLAGQPPMLFKRDYERLIFRQDDADQNHVTAYVTVLHHEKAAYPAWFKRLEDLGYITVGAEIPNGTLQYEKVYSTRLIKSVMNQGPLKDGGRKELWVTRRSLPINNSAPGIGATCKSPGAENVGFDNQVDEQLDHDRAMHAYSYLCDPQWDSIPADYTRTSSQMFVFQSLWLLNDAEHAHLRAQEVIPDYFAPREHRLAPPKLPNSEDRALRPDERTKFCDWLAPFTQRPNHKES